MYFCACFFGGWGGGRTLLLGRCLSGTVGSEHMGILPTSLQGSAPTPTPWAVPQPPRCFLALITFGIIDLLNFSQHGGCVVVSYRGSNLDFPND